jgi:peptidoglycan/LPS O-acetylase OafA/YrhL
MRAVAALVVYLNHAYAQIFSRDVVNDSSLGLLGIVRYSMVAGHLAVTVFIVISGFCLTLPVVAFGDRLRGGTVRFFKRRARRILPAYYASVAFALVLIWTIIGNPTGTLWDVPIRVTPAAIVSHLLLLQDLFGTSRINYVLWSIAVEWHIYFFFPLLVWGWRRFGPGRTVIAALLLGYAPQLVFHSTRIMRANPHFLGMFALGMLAAYVSSSPRAPYVSLRLRIPWRLTFAFTTTLVCVLIGTWGVSTAIARWQLLDPLVAVMTASLLVLSSRPEGSVLSHIFGCRPLAAIGTFSYSLYLIHAPLLQVMWQYVLRPANAGDRAMFVFLMTVGLAAVLSVSHLFYRLFEEPFMRPGPVTQPRDAVQVPVALA